MFTYDKNYRNPQRNENTSYLLKTIILKPICNFNKTF